MSATAIQQLAERLRASDPAKAQDQREIFERIRELRSAFDGPLDPESHRCLEAAGMLVAYLARMGALAGEDVRAIAVRLLHDAALAEGSAAGQPLVPPTPGPPPARPTVHKLSFAGSSSPLGAPSVPPVSSARFEGSATDLVGDMMLGQILLQRGHILEEHVHQAMKVQRATKLRIGEVFVKIGACTAAQVADALSHQAALRRVRESAGPQPTRVEPNDARGTGLKLVGEAMLGEILIERNVITRRQLERALEVQKQTGMRIGEALVKLGATTLEQIEQALRIQGRDRRFGARSTAASPGKDAGESKK
jgi:hypothetical protein